MHEVKVEQRQAALLRWFDAHARALPWRRVDLGGRRDPYRVWVSEILLQQTQVVRGTFYFERFMQAFPDVQALSTAPLEAVLKAWEGCGYYARARNLHKAAQQLAERGFPDTYKGWLALPGVGPYTAAAVSSLAYGEARAVNDGNVRRVLSRLWAEAHPSEAWVQQRADELLDRARPGDWNEALMDLGATVCLPKSPRCPACPLSAHCAAFASGEPGAYPAPKRRTPVKTVRAAALLIGDADSAYLEQRGGTLLGGLFGLPIEEGPPEEALPRLLKRLNAVSPRHLGTVNHTMTHRQITLEVYAAEAPVALEPAAGRPLSRLDHKALALLDRADVQGRLWSVPEAEGVD
ncbi:A/G-specific adenine glycosylase [Deinococcus irradiatisoli]|uniref:Adenine DNA glycosylase n=1 Tax=Deinococcus irradiatisoli TaxID=2202254 RepID=A0A2Z3JA97_9DEIO|nr:A/G-specific adenine glycosylase [Deinococcus irradiatisoli]AWN22037.1 A/G-specific adenine glycosylase [Deinococcus irradiatisoli]